LPSNRLELRTRILWLWICNLRRKIKIFTEYWTKWSNLRQGQNSSEWTLYRWTRLTT
jgi:hypothetical protein